jgi:hypothetical protein
MLYATEVADAVLRAVRGERERSRSAASVMAWSDRVPADARDVHQLLYIIFHKSPHKQPWNDGEDPLNALCHELRLSRFLTTNYDREIENWSRCRDWSPRDEAGADGGPFITSRGYGEGNAAEFVLFATRPVAPPQRDVFHLHGIMTRDNDPSQPQLVISEQDYQRHYLSRGDVNHELFREALELGFSCNAILFVGLGMTEEDINRPLRQFVADRARRGERSLFALLETPCPVPGDFRDEQAWSDEVKALRLERRQYLWSCYGVRSIFTQGPSWAELG